MGGGKPTKEGIAERLRLARERAGLSQGQVARLMSVHRPAITEIEAGRRKVAAEELTQFADLYGVSIAWLARGATELEDGVESEIKLAARDLAKLKPQDRQAVITLLRTLKQPEGKSR